MKQLTIIQKFILFVVVSVGFVLALTVFITRNLLQAYALQTADDIAAIVLDRTERQLSQLFSDVEALARGLGATRQVQSVDPQGMRDLFLAQVLARKNYIRAIYLGTVSGSMYEWGYGEGFIDHVPTFPPGYDPRVRPWYQSALRKNDFVISDPYIYASIDALGITFALPIYTQDQELLGVLGIDILLETLENILVDLAMPKNSRAAIIDSQGRVLADQFNPRNPMELTLSPLSIPGGEYITQSHAGVFSSLIDNEEMYFVFQRMADVDWFILVGFPLSIVYATPAQLIRVISSIDIIMIITLLLILVSITNKLILQPIHHIIRIINQKNLGNRPIRVSLRGNDEFAILGNQLNTLLDTVDGYSQEMEQKVMERTEDVLALQRENMGLKITEERQRIFRDIHDSLGAKLTNIFFSTMVAKEVGKVEGAKLEDPRIQSQRISHPRSMKELLEIIESNCTQAIQDLKLIVQGSDAEDNTEAGDGKDLFSPLVSRLEDIGIHAEIHSDVPDCSSQFEAPLYSQLEKVFDELVSNIIKHSLASRVTFNVYRTHSDITIIVSDNGVGFSTKSMSSKGNGIPNVHYRIHELSGQIQFNSKPGKGTEIIIHLPIQKGRVDE